MSAGREISRLLVVIPNWVGDVVMASPVLAALREHLSQTHIAYLTRPYVSDILDGSGWADASHHWPSGKGFAGLTATFSLTRELRAERYDTVILLPNSFRSALVAWLAGIPRRIGYDRDGRGTLLTERLLPLRSGGDYVPVPMLPYYAALAERIGVSVTDGRLRLGISDIQDVKGRELLAHYGLEPGRYAVINPGAAFGAAKCWLPENFAGVCDRVRDEMGLTPVLVGAPREKELLEAIAKDCQKPPVWCMDPGTTLGSLKVVIREAAILICNDTGPRHYGFAFNTPTVTVFGPTFREWAETHYDHEIILQALVPCGPCQLNRCPRDLECMRAVTVDDVMAAAGRLLSNTSQAMNPETMKSWRAAC